MRVILLAAAMLILAAPAFALGQLRNIAPLSGTQGRSGNKRMSGVVGDVVAGHSVGGSADLWHGFYAPLPASTVDVDGPVAAFSSYLGHPQPNPARRSTEIEFGLAVKQPVRLLIYDVAGRRIRQVHRGPLDAGVHRVTWDLSADDGRRVSTGIYFAHLRLAERTVTRRVLVMH